MSCVHFLLTGRGSVRYMNGSNVMETCRQKQHYHQQRSANPLPSIRVDSPSRTLDKLAYFDTALGKGPQSHCRSSSCTPPSFPSRAPRTPSSRLRLSTLVSRRKAFSARDSSLRAGHRGGTREAPASRAACSRRTEGHGWRFDA